MHAPCRHAREMDARESRARAVRAECDNAFVHLSSVERGLLQQQHAISTSIREMNERRWQRSGQVERVDVEKMECC